MHIENVMISYFRMTSRFPITSNPPSVAPPQAMSVNAKIPGTSQNTALSGNVASSGMFRFPPPPLPPNSKQFPSMTFDVPPPPLPQQLNIANTETEHRSAFSHHLSGHQQAEKNQQNPNTESAFQQQNPSLVNPQRATAGTNFPNNHPSQQPHAQNSQHTGNSGNQMKGGGRKVYQNPPQQSFQQMAPGNERVHLGGSANDRLSFGGLKPQTVPTQLQNTASQFHLLNQLLNMNANMGRMNMRPPGMQGSMEQPGKKEDFPFVPPELLGALSQLAVQVYSLYVLVTNTTLHLSTLL